MRESSECEELNGAIEKLFYYKEFSMENAENLLERAQKLYEKQFAMVGKKTPPNNKVLLSWEFITLGFNIEALRQTIFLNKLRYNKNSIASMNEEIERSLGLDYYEDIRPLESLLRSANGLYSEQLEIIMQQFHSVREKTLPSDIIALAANIEGLRNKIEQERPKILRPYEESRRQRERDAVIRSNADIDAYRESLVDARNARNEEGSYGR